MTPGAALGAGLKATSTAAHCSEAPKLAAADADPAAGCVMSSAMSLVLGAAGTRSSSVYPLPATKVVGFAVMIAPSRRSPAEVVVRVPLAGEALVPCLPTVASSAPEGATPAYSRMENWRAPDTDWVTVTAS